MLPRRSQNALTRPHVSIRTPLFRLPSEVCIRVFLLQERQADESHRQYSHVVIIAPGRLLRFDAGHTPQLPVSGSASQRLAGIALLLSVPFLATAPFFRSAPGALQLPEATPDLNLFLLNSPLPASEPEDASMNAYCCGCPPSLSGPTGRFPFSLSHHLSLLPVCVAPWDLSFGCARMMIRFCGSLSSCRRMARSEIVSSFCSLRRIFGRPSRLLPRSCREGQDA